MQTITTKSQKFIERFNKRSNAWLESFKSFSEDEINIRSEENAWNLALLYDHVMKVAYTYQLEYAQRANDSDNLKEQKNAFGVLLFDIDFQPRFSFRLEDFPPDLRDKFTPELKTKAELIEEFTAFINDVNIKFGQLQSDATKGVTKHPMFGSINSLNWLRLIEIHLKHHEKQRKRIIKAIQN